MFNGQIVKQAICFFVCEMKGAITIIETFHFSISMISRGKGKSAVASAAYISCEKLTNEWDGVTHDYHNKKGLLHSEIFLPENVPIELRYC